MSLKYHLFFILSLFSQPLLQQHLQRRNNPENISILFHKLQTASATVWGFPSNADAGIPSGSQSAFIYIAVSPR